MLILIKKIKRILPKSIRIKIPKEIGVVEVKSNQSGLLNKIYRGHKKPTNVLSFDYGPTYGEILVCPEIIREEAQKQGNSFKYQMTWIILHGMIHLAGIHHEHSEVIAKKVARLEKRILQSLKVK